MKKKFYYIFFLFFVLSCDKKDDTKQIKNSVIPSDSFVVDFNNKQLTESLKKSIFKGDTLAYEKLKEIYYLSGNKNEFFFYSFYMAKNFKHIRAYNDCYFNLKYQYKNENDKFLNRTTEYFLLKTYENMPEKIETSIEEFYGDIKNVPKSSSFIE